MIKQPPWTRFRIAIVVAVLAIVGLHVSHAASYTDGAAFVVIAAGMQGPARRVASWHTTAVTQMGVQPIPWRGGPLKSRASQPYHAPGRAILLVPGVHAAGIDEPRLVGFARDIAAMGHPVLTVELPDLAHYE